MNSITGISANVEQRESGALDQAQPSVATPWFQHLEPIIVFALAVTAFYVHLLHMNVPNITLVFDSTGYLAVTNSWLALLRPEFFSQVGSYILHGFQNSDRVLLVQQMGAASEVLKTGPLLPLILASAYKLANLPALSPHWQVGALSMIAVQSTTVTLMWLIARQCWGTTSARLAVFFALSYTGLVINSGRLMSEIPAACAIAFAAWTLLKVTRPSGNPLRSGLLLGISLALLMVARSVLVLLPAILLPLLFLCLRQDPSASATAIRRKLLSPSFIGAAAISAFVLLAPWALCEQILTGRPSIMIDRYGAYNLFTGLDVNNDALDVLPSPLVSHPEQYKPTAAQALATAADHAVHAPRQFLDMMLRKPARLADSPWSDFQTACWKMPWVIQVWWHQFLLLLGALGLLQAARQAGKSEAAEQRVAPLVLGTIVVYHLINCAFITMRRYMFTATPEVLILAAAGVILLWKHSSRRQFGLLLAATAALPTTNLLISLAQVAPHDWLAQAASGVGVFAVRAAVTLLVAAVTLIWFRTVANKTDNRWLLAGWGLAALSTTVVSMVNSWHLIGNLEGSLTLNKNTPQVSVRMPGVAVNPSHRYFVVVDCHSASPAPKPLNGLALMVNDHVVPEPFQPLFAFDRNQRENFLYERVFAASAGVEADSFRQWYVVEIPASALATNNSGALVRLENQTPEKPLYLATDFAGTGFEHELSLTRFSWTKGFMINPAGEMRVDQWKQPGSGQGIVPRIYMLVVEERPITDNTKAGSITLPDTRISKATTERLFQYTIQRNQLPQFVDGNAARNSGVLLRVRGLVRAPQGHGDASIGVVEYRYKEGKRVEELAPLAPSVITGTSDWQPFEFCDLIPLERQSHESTGNLHGGMAVCGLDSLRLIVAGHNWFDLLQYANYRPRGTVEIKNLQVELQPTELIDLSQKNWHRIKPLPLTGSQPL